VRVSYALLATPHERHSGAPGLPGPGAPCEPARHSQSVAAMPACCRR